MNKGKLIVFEGLDRCGKTTQVNLLHQGLQNLQIPSIVLKFPNRDTPIGKIIDSYLQNKEHVIFTGENDMPLQGKDIDDRVIHLLFSANRWEMSNYIINLLNSGTNVILDRYIYSGIVYSVAKGLNIEWCKSCDIGLPEPDIVIYIDCSIKTITERADYGEERYEKTQFLEKVKKMYEMFFNNKFWNNVDGDRTVDEIHSNIFETIKNDLKF